MKPMDYDLLFKCKEFSAALASSARILFVAKASENDSSAIYESVLEKYKE